MWLREILIEIANDYKLDSREVTRLLEKILIELGIIKKEEADWIEKQSE